MINKTVALGVLALATVASVTLWVGRGREKPFGSRLKQAVLKADVLADVTAIEIKKADATLKLARGSDNTWRIGDPATGKVANADRTLQLLDQLSQITFEQTVGVDKDGLTEFGLVTPTYVSMTVKDQVVAEINLGNTRARGGQYVMVPRDSSIYLVGQPVYASLDEGSWVHEDSPAKSASTVLPSPSSMSPSTRQASSPP